MKEITLSFQLETNHHSQRIHRNSSHHAERNVWNPLQFCVTIQSDKLKGSPQTVDYLTIITGVCLTTNNRISINQQFLVSLLCRFYFQPTNGSREGRKRAQNLAYVFCMRVQASCYFFLRNLCLMLKLKKGRHAGSEGVSGYCG